MIDKPCTKQLNNVLASLRAWPLACCWPAAWGFYMEFSTNPTKRGCYWENKAESRR